MPVCYGSGGCGNVFKRVRQHGAREGCVDEPKPALKSEAKRAPLTRRKRSDYEKPCSDSGMRLGLSVIEADILSAIEGHGGCYSSTTASFAAELHLSRKAFQEAKRYLVSLGLLGFSCVHDDLGATRCIEYRLTEKGVGYLSGEYDPFPERKKDEQR